MLNSRGPCRPKIFHFRLQGSPYDHSFRIPLSELASKELTPDWLQSATKYLFLSRLVSSYCCSPTIQTASRRFPLVYFVKCANILQKRGVTAVTVILMLTLRNQAGLFSFLGTQQQLWWAHLIFRTFTTCHHLQGVYTRKLPHVTVQAGLIHLEMWVKLNFLLS